MAVYEYRAVDRAGKTTKGGLEADSARAARSQLRARGLYPVEIRPAGKISTGREPSGGFGRVSARELAGAVRQLAVLIGAGLPVVDALAAAAEQAGSSRLGTILGQVKDQVVAGKGLAEALAEFPRDFPEVAVNMIRSGEAAGALEVVLERLAELLESRVRLTRRIRAALAYPIFMFVVGGAILAFMFAYVVPTVSSIFEATGQILPLPTRLLIALAAAVRGYGWVLAPLAAAAFLAWRQVSRSRVGRRWLDRLKLRLPFVGPVIRRLILVRFSRTMATLLASGVTVVDALAITAKVAGNAVYQDSLEAAREKIEAGASLAEHLEPARIWPPLVRRLVAAGERSASLETVFDRLAIGLEEEVESRLTGLLSLLEPVMILILGGMVGFIVVSILLPIFDMTRLVG